MRPDASKPAVPALPEGTLPSLEADLAELAAKFAVHTGAALSPELSADLALEIVLNEIVDQACLATAATGAAIVLMRDGELVCRASCGETAPELGARLDTDSGLSARCIQTGQIQRCDDAQVDPSADAEACWQMGVRSVVVLPLLRGTEVVGILEALSSRPSAFSERDEVTLDALAQRVVENLERAAKPFAVEGSTLWHPVFPEANRESRTSEDFQNSGGAERWGDDVPVEPATETVPRRRIDVVAWALGAAVLACALLIGVLAGQRFAGRKAASRAHLRQPVTTGAVATPQAQPGMSPVPVPSPGASSVKGAVAKSSARPADAGVPEGSLQVYDENGKEVFRLPPAAAAPSSQSAGVERAASVEQDRVVQLSAAAAAVSLLHRVEPDYPEEARQQQVQGAVVLEVHIGQDGGVQEVKLVSGHPLLAQAAMDAVKQWRFKTRSVAERQVEMQTRITLNFRLPH